MSESVINMYSDTVTKPSPAMRQAMANAEVGDDMGGEDPTVNRLEAMAVELFGKEAAVFACSGTQSNQMGVRTHCIPGDELLIEERGHIANFEGGAPAAISGISCRTIRGRFGMLDVDDLIGKVRVDNQHLCVTKLLCLENTTNSGGGRVWPLEQLKRVCDWAHEAGLKTHLDGARFFNAVIASGVSPAEIAAGFDTVSICFSKGLGCPMGSILVGSTEQIHRARRIRKLMGGALRQAGIVAAAAIYALENNVERITEDHANAKAFAEALAGTDGVIIDPVDVESNLVFFSIDPDLGDAMQLSAALKERGVRIGGMGPQTLRACTHLDVNREQVLQAAEIVKDCIATGFAQYPKKPFGPFARA
ncbi:aminotransferase class I/II-fold pyridoxal phosphate-dependent enzyme [bacterium]|nr:aminotransferase class I/II-fold pyridoxal phosphate-dependent enzyme [bacterium]